MSEARTDDLKQACPICGSARSREYCRKESHGGTWEVRRCGECGHGFVANPPSLERLGEIQGGLAAETDDARGDADVTGDAAAEMLAPPAADAENGNFARVVSRLTSLRGPTLDVGSGGGSTTLALSRAGFTGPHLLIDFDPRAAAATAHIPSSTFRRVAYEQISEESQRFDVIVMSHVLEHSLDPLDWLRRADRLLSPGGILAISLPNFGGVYRVLGERDPFLIPPVHLQYFTPASLRIAVERSGLTLLRMDSRSNVALDRVGQRVSLKSQILRRTWNAGAAGLNLTTRGIVLRAFAAPGRAR